MISGGNGRQLPSDELVWAGLADWEDKCCACRVQWIRANHIELLRAPPEEFFLSEIREGLTGCDRETRHF